MMTETAHSLERGFAERALMNLARKAAARPAVLAEWERAVREADPRSGCVTVPRQELCFYQRAKQGCQMGYFHTKNPNFGKLRRS
jgi:hypothetical protein